VGGVPHQDGRLVGAQDVDGFAHQRLEDVVHIQGAVQGLVGAVQRAQLACARRNPLLEHALGFDLVGDVTDDA
jgi:hypothetical protein